MNKEDIIIYIKQNLKTIILAFITSIFLFLCCFYFYNKINNNNNYQDSNQYIEITDTNKNTNTEDNFEQENSSKIILIDIKGEVKNPGVYEMKEEDRIKDAIDKAGGLTNVGSTKDINLSQKVKDQMLIIISKKGEERKITSNSSTSNSNFININLANEEELMKISGVGKVKAKAIIDYRENVGSFKRKEDIMKVRGIGKGTFEKIKNQIEV